MFPVPSDKNFSKLIEFTYEIINSLKGSKLVDERMRDCESLASKVFMQSSTIHFLTKGTRLTLKSFKGEDPFLYDIHSIAVLTRSTLETFFKLYEVYFDEINDDEFEYRYCVYMIAGKKLVETIVKNDPAASYTDNRVVSRIKEIIQEIEILRDRVKKTEHYSKLTQKHQRASLEGAIYPVSTKQSISKLLGWNSEYISEAYAILSAYVHSDSFSSSQTFIDDSEKQKSMAVFSWLVMIILANLIYNFSKKFPEAKIIYEGDPEGFRFVNWLKTVDFKRTTKVR